MQDADNTFDTPLANLPKGEWLKKLAQISEEHGFFQPLGKRHFATFVEDEPALLVTFETIQGIRSLSDTAQPLGWEMVKGVGWSHLCIVSDGDTWFRDQRVYAYFDRLIDDGFFDNFEKVIFYGAGPCAYAAAAFSVAAPGATVVAIQPQATLDPRVTEWDDRFTEMRRTDFNDRYGYAPDMLDAAEHAYVLYDPAATLDAMHAALFTRPNVTKFRLRNMGTALQTELLEMQVLLRILAKASKGKLTTQGFAKIFRARRENRNYLRNLLAHLDAKGRTKLGKMLCESVAKRGNAPYFTRRLAQFNAQDAASAEDQSTH